MEGLAKQIEYTIRPSKLAVNNSRLEFETNLESNFSFNFLRSLFSLTIDKVCIYLIIDEGDCLTVNYKVRFFRILILGLFPVTVGSVGFTVVSGLKIEDFILTLIIVYGCFTLMILLFALISLICLQYILLDEINSTEIKFRKQEFD